MKYFRLVGTTDDEYTILEADDEYKFGELYYHYIHEEDIEIYTTLDDNDERIEFIIGARNFEGVEDVMASKKSYFPVIWSDEDNSYIYITGHKKEPSE